jgi:hypothetical protein
MLRDVIWSMVRNRHRITEDLDQQQDRCENLRFHNMLTMFHNMMTVTAYKAVHFCYTIQLTHDTTIIEVSTSLAKLET